MIYRAHENTENNKSQIHVPTFAVPHKRRMTDSCNRDTRKTAAVYSSIKEQVVFILYSLRTSSMQIPSSQLQSDRSLRPQVKQRSNMVINTLSDMEAGNIQQIVPTAVTRSCSQVITYFRESQHEERTLGQHLS